VRALYLDSSAFVKVLIAEPESGALRKFLSDGPERRGSSARIRAEALRAVRQLGSVALATVREGLRGVDLIAIDDRILDAAGILEPAILRTLDAIHVATALAMGDDLSAVVTYDDRMTEAARLLGLPTVSPGSA
jgi:predicted nucleic acid-binding protein